MTRPSSRDLYGADDPFVTDCARCYVRVLEFCPGDFRKYKCPVCGRSDALVCEVR